MNQSEVKYARSLNIQKYRKESNAYLIEGAKIVKEWLLNKADIQLLIGTEQWFHEHQSIISDLLNDKIRIVAFHTIEKISSLKTAPEVIAVVTQKEEHTPIFTDKGWTLVLDRIQDPGNMGTIIRTADWFGIQEIICSPGCVDIYNPKVVQSTMGSLLRVDIAVMELETLIYNARKAVYATSLQGESIDVLAEKKIKDGYILLGNESQGVSPHLLNIVQQKITIPRIGKAESLNVGVACGIICSHLCKDR